MRNAREQQEDDPAYYFFPIPVRRFRCSCDTLPLKRFELFAHIQVSPRTDDYVKLRYQSLFRVGIAL